MEKQLIESLLSGHVEGVEALLKDHPDFNVNWGDEIKRTALHAASLNGQTEVVKLLLAHPAINVNVQTSDRATPILFSCAFGQLSVVQVLLKDPRVNVTLADRDEHTPLWWTARYGRHEVLLWLIASGRNLGDLNKKGVSGGEEYSALEIARQNNNMKVVALLERFVTNQGQTRHEVRLSLGLQDEVAAEIFAFVVFLCFDLLQLNPALASTTTGVTAAAAVRFFAIARRLPMELQMIVSHRAIGSGKDGILSKDSEAAFKSLARILFLVPF